MPTAALTLPSSFCTALPRQIMVVLYIQLTLGLASMGAWALTGDVIWVLEYFRYAGSMFLLFTCVVEAWAAFMTWRSFLPGEPMELSWFLLLMAGACRAGGTFIAHIVAPLLPEAGQLLVTGPAREMGLAISGPMHMALMAGGLGIAIRCYRRLGLVGRLRSADYLIITISLTFAAHQIHEVIQYFPQFARRLSPFNYITLVTDLMLTVLTLEAVVLWRSSRRMRGGLLGKCWGAYSAGILLTSLGDVGLWASSWGHIPWPLGSITWFIWFPAAAAFALGPAYQYSALVRARSAASAVEVVPGEAVRG
ncbi:MAG: hypothetical protein JNL98_25380 [Bryobacterales bacterium]|nr:hypothetical protein [Bryobacterales bacterium]